MIWYIYIYICVCVHEIWYACKRYINKYYNLCTKKASAVPSNPPTVEPTSFLVANLVSESCPWMAILDVAHWWSPFRNPSAFFTYCKSIPSPPIPRVRECWCCSSSPFLWRSQKNVGLPCVKLLGSLPQVFRQRNRTGGQAWWRGGVCSVNIDWPGETGTLNVYKGGPPNDRYIWSEITPI